jgi:endonuclease/exonuclease/phosphatase (EEP) superfamily protein YafD
MKVMQRLWQKLALVSLAAAVLWMLAISMIGQSWHWLALVMHLPPFIVPGVLVAVALPGLFFGKRLMLVLLGAALILAGPMLGYRTHGTKLSQLVTSANQLRVMTCNRGQHHGHSLAPFLQQTQPDVLLIQDANVPMGLKPNPPELAAFSHSSRIGELALLSKHPIVSNKLVIVPVTGTTQIHGPWNRLMRTVLRWQGREVVIFSLHLPSPRHPMQIYREGKIWEAGGKDRAVRLWESHRAVMSAVLEHMEQDMASSGLPTVVTGDWNQPALGAQYRRLKQVLTDSHSEQGQGYGFTCPGDLAAPWPLPSPWLRIDYVLSSGHWRVLGHEVEPRSQAQHCAVVAALELR